MSRAYMLRTSIYHITTSPLIWNGIKETNQRDFHQTQPRYYETFYRLHENFSHTRRITKSKKFGEVIFRTSLVRTFGPHDPADFALFWIFSAAFSAAFSDFLVFFSSHPSRPISYSLVLLLQIFSQKNKKSKHNDAFSRKVTILDGESAVNRRSRLDNYLGQKSWKLRRRRIICMIWLSTKISQKVTKK